ncbi:nuclear transport factor 2 family protein [Halocynthiibacter namhaensis]|uniref:nuclear transport factor 2 family protein n=1 Tax=Halocynthiibacter namhaensis TaxID=1290553 RepID=UPI000578FBBA|nr:nuclear transport factor 2 family protein [Halocynthiibacter namhaensis]
MENKELVANFIETMRLSDVAKLTTLITDDFSWWIAGKPEYLQTAGEHDKEFFLGFFAGGADLFPNGAEFSVSGMIAEGDKVAAEARMVAQTAMGSQYDNSYHFLFTLRDGKIARMKEYMDTHHAKTTFGM